MRKFSLWNIPTYFLPIFLVFGGLHACERAPNPDFSFLPRENLEAGDSIWFTNLSRDGYDFEWDFGDSTFSKNFNPIHVYQEPGIYMAQLSATSETGEGSIVSSMLINDPTVLGFIVYDSTAMLPLKNAAIWIYKNPADRDSLSTPDYSGLSNSEGIADFRNVDPMVYHVWIIKQETNGYWAYRGFTSSLLRNKVNRFTVPCNWYDGTSFPPGALHQLRYHPPI